MTKQVTHIDCPSKWESTNDWDSHRPLLYLTINKVPHEVVHEFGMGDGSTPLLTKWYNEVNILHKEYYSYETNNFWANKYLSEDYTQSPYRNNAYLYKNHCIVLVENYLDWNIFGEAIVFIDSAPGEQRKELIEKYANKVVVILVHDSEVSSSYVYGLEPILSTFKYRLDYQPEGKPHTTAVSNFIDVTQWL